MATSRADILVRAIRDRTGNQSYSATNGVPQREIVSYLNEAQDRIFNKISMERSSLFTKESFISTVANQASYTLPTDILLKHNIIKVDYSHNGSAQNYAPLDLRSPRQEISVAGYPDSYFLRDGTLILSPIPSSSITNGIRLNYQYTIPTIDIRRGQVASYASGGTNVTSITLTSNSLLIAESESDLENGYVEYISIVNKDGVQTAVNIPIVSYNSTTNVATCNHTLGSGESIAVGSYVVFGKNATTHSSLLPICERYLLEYGVLRTQMRDSNANLMDTSPLLTAIEQEIIDSIAGLEEDIVAIPILDYSMLNYTEDYH
jgi:hypothetical protein